MVCYDPVCLPTSECNMALASACFHCGQWEILCEYVSPCLNENHTAEIMGFKSLKVLFIFPPIGHQSYCPPG